MKIFRKPMSCVYEQQLFPQWTSRTYQALASEGYTKNVIVYRCVHLISRGISTVPLVLYKGTEVCNKHELIDLVENPNNQTSRASFFEELVSFWLLSGNAFIYASVTNGLPDTLYTMRPDRVSVSTSNGETQYSYSVNNRSTLIPKDGILIHLKSFHPLNDILGLSPVEVAASSIDQHNAVGGHNLAVLQNGGRPSGAFVFKGNNGYRLTEDQRSSIKSDLKHFYQGAGNAGNVLIMEGDFEWKEMGMSPKDLDFLEGKHVSAREIAQAYGVPPMLVGVPGDATYANYKEARYHLWEDTILPILDSILDAFNAKISNLFGDYKFAYSRDSISALSPKREAYWNKITSAPFLTVNEKREALGYSPLSQEDLNALAD
jgi:HK97 family phage portal protein